MESVIKNVLLNNTNVEWVNISLPLLKMSDVGLIFLKCGLLLANVGVYSYLFSEIFFYVFHKKLKGLYDIKLNSVQESLTYVMEKIKNAVVLIPAILFIYFRIFLIGLCATESKK